MLPSQKYFMLGLGMFWSFDEMMYSCKMTAVRVICQQ